MLRFFGDEPERRSAAARQPRRRPAAATRSPSRCWRRRAGSRWDVTLVERGPALRRRRDARAPRRRVAMLAPRRAMPAVVLRPSARRASERRSLNAGPAHARRVRPRHDAPEPSSPTREWLVTNGLGGYASGTIGGVADAPLSRPARSPRCRNPLGRTMMLNQRRRELDRLADGDVSAGRRGRAAISSRRPTLSPSSGSSWACRSGGSTSSGVRLEKRLLLPHAPEHRRRHLSPARRAGAGCGCALRPASTSAATRPPSAGSCRRLHGLRVTADALRAVASREPYPPLRMSRAAASARASSFEPSSGASVALPRRGSARLRRRAASCWSPGRFDVHARPRDQRRRRWSLDRDLGHHRWRSTPDEPRECERERRHRLLGEAQPRRRTRGCAAELVLGGRSVRDPPGRPRRGRGPRARRAATRLRTVIAGYHWFTDWGRDTMISLEGLTLVHRPAREARLRSCARSPHYVRDGLIPNLFPEGENEGLYHTADATLWFFHALRPLPRASRATGRRCASSCRRCATIVRTTTSRGTRFGIGVDPDDGLLRAGRGRLPAHLDGRQGAATGS